MRYGPSAGAASALLKPIRVEHDRALHPERRALASIMAELIAGAMGGRLAKLKVAVKVRSPY